MTSHAAPSFSAGDFVLAENEAHPVVIYSKTYCPWCRNIKMLFRSIDGLDVKIHELDQHEHGPAIQQALAAIISKGGQTTTVPQVFVWAKHVGGHDDVVDMYRDKSLATVLESGSG